MLVGELKIEEEELQQSLSEIDFALRKNEEHIQELTGLPTQAETAMNQILELAAKQEYHLSPRIPIQSRGQDSRVAPGRTARPSGYPPPGLRRPARPTGGNSWAGGRGPPP